MNLRDHLNQLASDHTVAPADTVMRCAMANFRWETAVSDERAYKYGDYVEAVASHKEWQAEHKRYLTRSVHITKDQPICAESFMAVNCTAQINEHLDNTFLLRLEVLDGLLSQSLLSEVVTSFWKRFFNSQNDLRKTKLSDADEALRAEFTIQWNAHRIHARPQFATFLDAFGSDLEALATQDWPHLMRDRLGLTHWPREEDKQLPVALICYTVDDVRQARLRAAKKGATASFSRPTVLDTEFSAAFIPAPLLPGGESYGYTLDLAGGVSASSALVPELLTFPVEYEPTHIKALGFITRPHALLHGGAFLPARNLHVNRLRTLPGCASFGELLL